MPPSDSHPRRGFTVRVTTILAALVATGLSLAAAARADQVDAVWIGGTGNWSAAANWSPAVVPNNAVDTYNVLIDNADDESASVVTLNQNAIIDNLTIDPGDQLDVANIRLLTLVAGEASGVIDNQGVIRLLSTGSVTDIRPSGGEITLTGGGVVIMSNNANNRIFGVSGGSLLIVDQLIRGAGQIGVNVTNVTNQGTIQADEAGPLTIDPAASPFVNMGVLRADSGGVLRLVNGSFASAAGTIEARDNSIVELSGATIIGGGGVSEPTGLIRVAGNSTLDADGGWFSLDGDVNVLNGVVLTVIGDVENAGTIHLASTGSTTDLRPSDGACNLTGGGTVNMGNHTNNRILGVSGGAIVNVDNTIQGSGQIGVNQTPITNHGFIIADQPTPLIVDPSTSPLINTGTLRADFGATLVLNPGDFDNTGGTIEALDASQVDLVSAAVFGGTLRDVDAGTIRVTGNCTLDGTGQAVTVDAALNLVNLANLMLRGTIINLGAFNLNSTGSVTDLEPTGGVVTLTGGGTVNLGNHTNNRILGVSGGTLINVDNTIRGAGQIGVNVTDGFINQGTVIADQPVSLVIDPAGTPFVNDGAFIADLGATLRLQGGGFNNAGGVIEARDASRVDISAATISGGTLTTAGSGVIRLPDSGTLDGVTDTLINQGRIDLLNDADITVRGTIQNEGLINVTTTGNFTDFEVTGGPVMFTGGGEIAMTNHANNRFFGVSGGSLVNVDNTIRGSGQIGINATPITNLGTIAADQPIALTINQDNTIGMSNQGMLRAAGGSTMAIGDGPFTTSGAVLVEAGAIMTRAGDFTQTAGTTTVDGTLDPTGIFDLQGGTLAGRGTIAANVTSSGTTAPGTSAGALTINGMFTQTAAGQLDIEVGGLLPGDEHDQLVVTGAATLDGTLTVSFIDGFVPAIGQTFTVMTYPSRTGNFVAVNVPCPPGFGVSVIVLDTSVVVEIVPPAASLGDMNCDCVVNFFDIEPFTLALIDSAAYLEQYGPCDPAKADVNADTDVDAGDIQGFIDLLIP